MKHPKIIELLIDFNDPSPVMEEVPKGDPGDLVRKRNEDKMRDWELRKRPYIETYFTLIAAVSITGATAWAMYSAL